MTVKKAMLIALVVSILVSPAKAEKQVSDDDKVLIAGFDSWARSDEHGSLLRSIPKKIVNVKYLKYLKYCKLDQSFHRYGSKRFASWRCDAAKDILKESDGELGAFFTFKSRGGINEIESVKFFELQIIVT